MVSFSGPEFLNPAPENLSFLLKQIAHDLVELTDNARQLRNDEATFSTADISSLELDALISVAQRSLHALRPVQQRCHSVTTAEPTRPRNAAWDRESPSAPTELIIIGRRVTRRIASAGYLALETFPPARCERFFAIASEFEKQLWLFNAPLATTEGPLGSRLLSRTSRLAI